jgi:hypothetical protein
LRFDGADNAPSLKGGKMPIAVLKLKGIEAVNRRIPKKGKRLGQMLVFSDDITRINGAPSPGPSQHSGFCFRVRKPDIWLCQAGYVLPGRPGTIFPNGGQIQARGLLDFSNSAPVRVAITGGTGDYRRASGEIVLTGTPPVTRFTVTLEIP